MAHRFTHPTDATVAGYFAPFAQQLTPQQKTAACHQQGHARVLAVAGAGKSSMLVGRIAWLLDQGVPAKRIRVLTYNREAADDFRRRVEQKLGRLPLVVQTFHSLGWKLLQHLGADGTLPNWSLATSGQETQLKRDALRHTQQETDQIEALGQAMEWVKAQALPFELGLKTLPESLTHLTISLKHLETLRQRAGIWFFTDMLYATWYALHQHPDKRTQFANHLDYMLVDEYQDVNEVQHQLLTWLAGERAQVMVVGDVDQCIYTWRGAQTSFLSERFAQDFSSVTTYHLPNTFRFGHRLALLANHAIAVNEWADRVPVLSSSFAPDTQLHLHQGHDIQHCAKILQEWQTEGNQLQDSAILFRTWSQSAVVELSLLQAGIPYRMLGDSSIWETTLAQGIIALLALADASLWQLPYEERLSALTAFWQCPPMGLRRSEREYLTKLSAQNPEQVAQAIESLPCERDWQKQQWRERGRIWNQLNTAQHDGTALTLLTQYWLDTDAESRFEKLAPTPSQGSMQVALLQAMMSMIPAHWTVSASLAHLRLLRQRATAGQQDDSAVTLTTIHRVKGREWHCVILAGLQDAIFPGNKSGDQQALLEEERRLFYVAITRAQQHLHLIVPDISTLMPLWRAGALGKEAGKTCRFMAETNFRLSNQLGAYLYRQTDQLPTGVDLHIANCYLTALDRQELLHSNPQQIHNLQKGHRVKHRNFGIGMVLQQQEDRLEIAFADGIRWLKAGHPALQAIHGGFL